MANKTIQQITGGEKTTPVATDTVELQETGGGISKFLQLANLYKAMAAATISIKGLMSASDKTKLDGVEASATADQTGAEIKTAYELEADTNAFDDAAASKLAGIESSATADQTNSEIKTAYELNADTNAFTDAEQTKLSGVATGADVTSTNETSHSDVVVDGDFSSNGAMERTGAGTYTTILNKRDATVAPAVTDDTGSGYAIGSRWIDTTADKEYVCLDASTGAAVWTETTGGGGSSSAADLTWAAGSQSEVADGATAIAFDLDTDAAYSTSGASLLRLSSGGVVAFTFSPSGVIYSTGDLTLQCKDNFKYIYLKGSANYAVIDDTRFNIGKSVLGFSLGSAITTRDVGVARSAAGVLAVVDSGTAGAALELREQASAPAAASNNARIFAQDNGSGKTQLMVQFGTGSPIQISIEV